MEQDSDRLDRRPVVRTTGDPNEHVRCAQTILERQRTGDRVKPSPIHVDRRRLGSIRLDTIRYQSARWIGAAVRRALLARPAAAVAAVREQIDSRGVSVAASSTARILRA